MGKQGRLRPFSGSAHHHTAGLHQDGERFSLYSLHRGLVSQGAQRRGNLWGDVPAEVLCALSCPCTRSLPGLGRRCGCERERRAHLFLAVQAASRVVLSAGGISTIASAPRRSLHVHMHARARMSLCMWAEE